MIYTDFFSNQYGYKNVWGFSYRPGYVILTNKKVIIRQFIDDSLNAYTVEYSLPEEIEPFSIVLSEYSENEFIITTFDIKSKSFKFLHFTDGIEGGFTYYSYEYNEDLFSDNPTIFNYLTSTYEAHDPSLFLQELYAIPLSNSIVYPNKLTSKMMLNEQFGETSINVTHITTNSSDSENYVDIKSMLTSTDPNRHLRINGVNYIGMVRFPYPNMVAPYLDILAPTNVSDNINFTTRADIIFYPKAGSTSIDEYVDTHVTECSIEFLYSDNYTTKIHPYDQNLESTEYLIAYDDYMSLWTEEYFASNPFRMNIFNGDLNIINIGYFSYDTTSYIYALRSNPSISSLYMSSGTDYNSFIDKIINGFFLFDVGYTINSSSDNEAYYTTLSYTQHIPYLWYDGIYRILSTIVSKNGLCIMISNVYIDESNFDTYNMKMVPTLGYVILKDYITDIPAVIPLFVTDKYMYLATVVVSKIDNEYYIDESILKIPLFEEMAVSEFKYDNRRPFDIFTTSKETLFSDGDYGITTNPLDFMVAAISSDLKEDDLPMTTLNSSSGKILFTSSSSYENQKPLTLTSKPALIFKEAKKDVITNKITYTVSFNVENVRKFVSNQTMDVIKL